LASLAWRTRSSILDGPSLARLRAALGDDQGLHDILDEFLVSSDAILRQMTDGLQHREARQVERAAHTLKSMAGLIGATTLADACRTVESQAHGHSHAAPALDPSLLERVAEHARDAQEAVERLLH
jgi:HPt (histidine-containing phosphotransfer) domain-containing protein